jgi:hypothetical protein
LDYYSPSSLSERVIFPQKRPTLTRFLAKIWEKHPTLARKTAPNWEVGLLSDRLLGEEFQNQVDFNPDVVAYYRLTVPGQALIGYENRDVADGCSSATA